MDEDPEERSVLVVGNEEWAKRVVGVLEATDLPVTVDPCVPETVALEDPEPAIVVLDTGCLTQADEFLERVERAWETTHLVYAPRAADVDPVRLGQLLEDGIDDYVPFEEREELLEGALERGLVAGDAAGQTKGGSKDLEAIAANPAVYLWRVAADGTIIETNDAAGAVSETCEGSRFAECPCWPVESQGALDAAIETALDGDHAERRVTVGRGAAELTLRLDVSPTADGECLVLGRDVTDTAQTIRELRRSEELHRVTLAHMTDTVLLTDADGQFTYVCPNVHFIFGYTAEEIHDMGTVEALLGPDLYDESELEEQGVLTNVECTATDRQGERHDLLINIRTVSIQDGRTLFSCRDVTARKDRERALTALHETARDLLYAEHRHEIAARIVEDTGEVLRLPLAAVFLFDSDENLLRPTATTAAFESAEPTWPGADDLVASTFLTDEARSFDGLGRWQETVGNLGSAVAVPLGDHGVYVAGDAGDEPLDPVTVELADLLAATAEAALDRVEQDAAMRTRDRTLQAQNERLTTVNRLNEIIRDVGQELVQAGTRSDVERAVCERLTDTDRFAFAWIGALTRGGTEIEPRALAGDAQGYLDLLGSGTLDHGPGYETVTTGSSMVVENVADDVRGARWRSVAVRCGFQSVVSVPLAYDEFGYGSLTVFATEPGTFDETSQAVFGELGQMIASAIGSIERTHALLGGATVEFTYTSAAGETVFEQLASAGDCTLDLEGGFQRIDDGVLAFVAVGGAAPDGIVERASQLLRVEDAHVVRHTESGGLVRLVLADSFLPTRLAEHGGVVTGISADPTETVLTLEVPTVVDGSAIESLVKRRYPDAQLVSRRERGATTTADGRLQSRVLESLTDRQLEVVRTAYHAGYFDTPRERSGADVAASLDISASAFSRHLRAVQSIVFAAIFDEYRDE